MKRSSLKRKFQIASDNFKIRDRLYSEREMYQDILHFRKDKKGLLLYQGLLYYVKRNVLLLIALK